MRWTTLFKCVNTSKKIWQAFVWWAKIDCNSENSTRCAIVCQSVSQSDVGCLAKNKEVRERTECALNWYNSWGWKEMRNLKFLIHYERHILWCIRVRGSSCPLLALIHSLSWHKKTKTIHTYLHTHTELNPFKLKHDSCHNVIHKFSIELVIQSN